MADIHEHQPTDISLVYLSAERTIRRCVWRRSYQLNAWVRHYQILGLLYGRPSALSMVTRYSYQMYGYPSVSGIILRLDGIGSSPREVRLQGSRTIGGGGK